MITAFKNEPILLNDDLFYHKALISSIDDVIISTDRNFIIRTWNAAAEKIYGIAAKDAIGQKMPGISFHQYVDTTPKCAQKKLAQENYWKGNVRVITKSGKIIFLQSVITTVRDSKQRKIGYVGVSRNITENTSLPRSFQNLQSILNAFNVSFFIIDRDMKIVFMRAKDNVHKFYNSDYHIGDNALKYIPQEFVNIVKQSYEKALNGETVNYNVVSQTQPKLYFNITYAPLKDHLGNITNACLIIRDCTAQKEIELLHEKKAAVEKNLFESRRFFEEFMENSPLLAWIEDDKGDIHYMNDAYLQLFKLKKEAIIGMNIFDLYSKESAEEYLANNKKVLVEGKAIEVIEKGRHPSLPEIYKIIKFPIYFKSETMIAAWGINISEEIARQEDLLLLNQNKNNIMSVIAHDIRAPLGINSNFMSTIIEDYEILSREKLFKYLTMMQQSLATCYTLTENLLLWARNQMQTIRYNPRPLEADKEINKVVENLLLAAENKKILIETRFCFTDEIFADPDMFAIALRNFVSNAVKFSPSGGKIIISTEISGEKLMINVQDSGVGIKKELSEKILRKLNYESAYGTKGEKGTGLGLIIAKDYIDRNNGEMYIQSEEGKGSVFSFTVGFVQTPVTVPS